MAAKDKVQSNGSKTKKLPEGFRRTNTGFPPNWDFSTSPVLEGTVVGTRTVTVKRGKKMDDCQVMDIETDDGVFAVWESASLSGLFEDAGKGSEVYIEFVGLVPMKGGKQDMKEFIAGIKE